ncbi:hypothetical protein CTAYLR_003994 [Chrysophaeum taylorii]|uniref:SAM-dependent MTase RsmB/NOP-type domain-containing protein n=1 Tax=Chrysophaeum taylorii TaxID=2483200 RepID=A0AAD7U9D0_9STRA|nr:hypothetical protein CTAYLR_003994 [Chrysophaeum taylorii]
MVFLFSLALAAYRERLRGVLPEAEWEAFVSASGRPLRRSARVTGRVPEAQISGERVPWDEKGYFAEIGGNDVAHLTGGVYIQEAAAMSAAAVLIEGGERLVVDACAAPGGKTVQLASTAECVVANDASSSRMASLAHNVQRCGASRRVVLCHGDARNVLASLEGSCCAVLVDAPCSGDTLSRRANTSLGAFLASSPAFREGALQRQLLSAAFLALRPGGKLVYSTCALDPAENEIVVRDFLDATPEAQLVGLDGPGADSALLPGTRRIWPHLEDTAGFFLAKIEKRGGEKPRPPEPKKKRCIFRDQLRAAWGIDEDLGSFVVRRKKVRNYELWIAPRDAPLDVLGVLVNRPGCKVLDALDHLDLETALKRDRVRWTHDFAVSCGWTVPLNHPRRVCLEDENHLVSYLRGHDLILQQQQRQPPLGCQVLVTRQDGLVLGLAKTRLPAGGAGLALKNQLPPAHRLRF